MNKELYKTKIENIIDKQKEEMLCQVDKILADIEVATAGGLKPGDFAFDPSDRVCKVTNTDTHIHVIYGNGKTHKWKKSANFTLLEDWEIPIHTRSWENI